jgi:hypothetical protein
MPRALDLAAINRSLPPSSRLTPIRLAKKPDRFGRRQWLCRCGCCSSFVAVPTSRLVTGKTRSCGCLRSRGGRPFTKKAARDEHKAATIRTTADGRRWLAPRVAAERVKESQTTLRQWDAREGGSCPWLNGAALETMTLPSAYSRNITYYAEGDIDRVVAAKAARLPVPEVPGHTYIGDALGELNCGEKVLRQRMRAAGVQVKKAGGKSKDGRALLRTYVPNDFIAKCRAEALKHLTPPDKVTVGEAAQIQAMKRAGVHSQIHRGDLKAHKGMAACCARPGKDGTRRSYLRASLLLSRADVEEKARGSPRDRWMDDRRREGATYKTIMNELAQKADTEGWDPIETVEGVWRAIQRFRARNV